jgi:lipopolysaccharide biosynthesis glycosyltransferase
VTTIDVACAVEGRGYAAHSAAMLHSLLAANREHDVRVHYMPGPGITARDEGRLREMVEREGARIEFLRVPAERLAGLPTRGFTREATWYRVLLPELLPDVERILYLDADLIVLDSLAPLWELDLAGSYVAAVTNVLEPVYAERPRELGIADGAYFNAGVLLMNLDELRRDGCQEALVEYARANAERLVWRDQDALNVVLGERRLELHPRWNCMNSVVAFPHAAAVLGADRVEEARRDPAIRHFEGPGDNKPWHLLCPWPGRELYREHRRATPWPRVWPEGVTPLGVLRRVGLAGGRASTHSLEDR